MLVLVICGVACQSVPAHVTPSPLPSSTPTGQLGDQRIVDALIAFSRSRSAPSFEAVPFAKTVALGLADRIDVSRDREELRQSEAWVLMPAGPWRGRAVAPFTALDLLASSGAITVSIGPHPHCASPPVPAPAGFAAQRRVSVQPTQIDTCILWWTVDLFVSGSGQIEAVTLDVWEP